MEASGSATYKYGGNVDVYAKQKGSSTTAFSVKKSCDCGADWRSG